MSKFTLLYFQPYYLEKTESEVFKTNVELDIVDIAIKANILPLDKDNNNVLRKSIYNQFPNTYFFISLSLYGYIKYNLPTSDYKDLVVLNTAMADKIITFPLQDHRLYNNEYLDKGFNHIPPIRPLYMLNSRESLDGSFNLTDSMISEVFNKISTRRRLTQYNEEPISKDVDDLLTLSNLDKYVGLKFSNLTIYEKNDCNVIVVSLKEGFGDYVLRSNTVDSNLDFRNKLLDIIVNTAKDNINKEDLINSQLFVDYLKSKR